MRAQTTTHGFVSKTFTILFVIFWGNIYSQSQQFFNVANQNLLMYNSSVSAQYEYSQIGINAIQEWGGFEGAPRSLNAYGSILDVEGERMGFSGFFSLEEFNNNQIIDLGLNYSYNLISLGRTVALGFGPRFNFYNFGWDESLNELTTRLSNAGSYSSLGVDLGAFYASKDPTQYYLNHYFVGLSSLVMNAFLSESPLVDPIEAKGVQLFSIVNLMGGYRYWISKNNFVEPRLNFTFNTEEQAVSSAIISFKFESFDYEQFTTKFGYFVSIAPIWNNNVQEGLSPFGSSLLNVHAGAIIKYYTLKELGLSNLLRVGAFYHVGLGEINRESAYNLGITLNFQFMDQGF